MPYRNLLGFLVLLPLCLALAQCRRTDNSVSARNALPNAPGNGKLPAPLVSPWKENVGSTLGIWVSVPEQRLRIIEGGKVILEFPCSTAANGVGCEKDSYKTPIGWHAVHEKIGEGAPWGQVFRWRKATEEVWTPGDVVKEDLVLTRVLVLRGEQPGLNKGGDVDSLSRHIYIHGTNDEERIGRPASYGCIRLRNDDVIQVFDRIPVDTPVLITE